MSKTILITGSSKGIGKVISSAAFDKGWHVIANWNKTKPIWYNTLWKSDLTSYECIEELNACLWAEQIKKIDYIIFNVGINERIPFNELTPPNWELPYRTHIAIPCMIIEALKDKLAENGSIVFIGSILGSIPKSLSVPYGVTKGAQEILVKYLAKELAYKNITVNCIEPGFVMTDWHSKRTEQDIKEISEQTLAKRFATPEEIAKVVINTLEMPYLTGQIIKICSGYDLQ